MKKNRKNKRYIVIEFDGTTTKACTFRGIKAEILAGEIRDFRSAKAKLHPDVLYALQTLTGRRKKGNYDDVLRAAYIHILLSRILPELTLKERVAQPTDLVDAVVTYIAAHSREEISLTSVAKALYISPYTLSRMFSSTFHTNFNRYVNHSRLEYSRMLLEETEQSVTEICLDAGFGSQRTFNRAFQTEFHMTPAQYRKQHREGKSS